MVLTIRDTGTDTKPAMHQNGTWPVLRKVKLLRLRGPYSLLAVLSGFFSFPLHAAKTGPVPVPVRSGNYLPSGRQVTTTDSHKNRYKCGKTVLLLITLSYLLFFLGGCASISQNRDIIAIVDDEPITNKELEYAIQIAHSREDLSSARALRISNYLDKIINDKLIIQEARRMNMEQYPEVQQSIQTYITRESVIKLYNEEIAKKINLSEDAIKNYYKENYERFALNIIESNSEEEAGRILEQLYRGDDFMEYAFQYSSHSSKKEKQEVVLTRRTLNPNFRKAILKLKPGEFSKVVAVKDKFYILKLIRREKADLAKLEKNRKKVTNGANKAKEKELSERFVERLRERAHLNINKELFSSIKLKGNEAEKERWLKDKRTLVAVNDSVLTVSDFIALIPPETGDTKEEILNGWIGRTLVDHEALNRNYMSEPGFRSKVNRYKEQLLKKAFIKRVIIPEIKISDEALEEYYLTHKDDYLKQVSYKIQQITVNSLKEARDVLNSLQNKADFSWLAKKMSTDQFAEKGGTRDWLSKKQLPEPAEKIIDTLKPGDISPILEFDSVYIIIRLQSRTRDEVEEFLKVRGDVYRAYTSEQFNSLSNSYLEQLKESAHIKIYDNNVRLFEESFKK